MEGQGETGRFLVNANLTEISFMSTELSRKSAETPVGLWQRVRDRLDKAAVDKGLSAREISRKAGQNVGYMGDFLASNKGADIERIMKLGEVLDVSVAQIVAEVEAGDSGGDNFTGTVSRGHIPLFAAKIATNRPLYKVPVKPVGQVRMLPGIADSADSYAFAVPNDVNAPRYIAGETVYISPSATITDGDFVFVRLDDGRAGVLRALTVTEARVVLQALDAEGPIAWARKDIEVLHRVTGASF